LYPCNGQTLHLKKRNSPKVDIPIMTQLICHVWTVEQHLHYTVSRYHELSGDFECNHSLDYGFS
ncbi:hypothetical protein, partial [Alteromonas stellipolaris]|uniref:hypothetical protein n=1 Tax=Alteromonas stellipolaris TaxID=233316 RepID=UPI001DB5353C